MRDARERQEKAAGSGGSHRNDRMSGRSQCACLLPRQIPDSKVPYKKENL